MVCLHVSNARFRWNSLQNPKETEFGAIRSRGKHRTASSLEPAEKMPKSCSRAQNWGNLLIPVFFRFQHPIPVKRPAKAHRKPSLVQFGPEGKRRTASSLSQPKKHPKVAPGRKISANLLIMVSSRFQRSIQVEWPAKAHRKPSLVQFGPEGSAGQQIGTVLAVFWRCFSWLEKRRCSALTLGSELRKIRVILG